MTLGALAALASAALWAFGSTRYALASRQVGAARVNLTRIATVVPLYFAFALGLSGSLFGALDGRAVAWLALSVVCAYGFADILFFAAARRLGITTALAIASSYPLWATLAGLLLRHESLGAPRLVGILLCVGGIVALVLQSPQAVDEHPHAHARRKEANEGVALALLTSLLWAGNTYATKVGGAAVSAWQANLVRCLVALPILAATSALVPRPSTSDSEARRTYRRLVPVAIVEAFVGSALFVYALVHTELAVGATLTSLAPLMSVPFALLYREERWRPRRFAAALVTVLGVIALVAGG